MNENSILFWLGVIANICQLQSYEILLNDFDNHDLMEYLEHQDLLMKKIIEQNKEILKLIKGEK